MPVSISGTNGVTFPDSSLQAAAASPYVLKNRIINGDFRIDQRNAGASVTPTSSAYTLDRWEAGMSVASKFSIQRSTTAPTGFTNSLLATSTSAYTVGASEVFVLTQFIEGYNVADMGFGTASASTFTISFWVRSSLTGTFGGSLQNSGRTRSYPFTYTISAANTWEQKTITVAGDTTGTWLTDNGRGINVIFALGAGSTFSGTANTWATANYYSATGATSVVGTSGATWYITGVQLEQNTSATPFERRLYNQELANCQRYFYKVNADAAYGTNRFGSVFFPTTTIAAGIIQFPVTMRTFPTGSYSSLSDWTISAAPGTLSVSAMSINTLPFNGEIDFTVSGATAGQGGQIRANTNTASISFSAEL